MPLLDSMDPRIGEEMTVHALDKIPGVLPAVVPWLFPGYEDLQTPDGKKGAFWDKEAWENYINLLKDPSSIGDGETEDTQANRTGLGLARLGTLATLNEYCSPLLGRPTVPPTAYLQQMNAGFGAVKKGTTIEEQIEIFKAQCSNTDPNLEGLYFLYFEQNRAGGEESVGWMSEAEKESFLTALSAQKSDSVKNRLLGLWKSLTDETDEDTFEALWNDRTQVIDRWYIRFNEREASTEILAFGEEATSAFPKLLGLKNSLEELYEMAQSDLKQIMTSIDKVRTACADVEIPELGFSDNEGLVLRATEILRTFGDGMELTSGLNTDEVEINVKDDSHLGSAAIATVNGQNMEFYPRDGQDEYWADKGARFPWVVLHEATHIRQNQSPHLTQWDTKIGKESTALGSEKAHLSAAPDDLNPHHLLQQLRSAAGNTATFIAAMKHHAGLDSDKGETAIQTLIAADVDPVIAERLWTEIQTNPWKWAIYWLGTKLFVQYADTDHEGDVRAAFKASLDESDGILPPHSISNGFEYGEYLIQRSTPWIVRESERRGY